MIRLLHANRRRGYSMTIVLVFLILMFALWGAVYRTTSGLLRIETNRISQQTRDQGAMNALAQAVQLLQYGKPPTNSGRTQYTYDVTVTVPARPASSPPPVPPCVTLDYTVVYTYSPITGNPGIPISGRFRCLPEALRCRYPRYHQAGPLSCGPECTSQRPAISHSAFRALSSENPSNEKNQDNRTDQSMTTTVTSRIGRNLRCRCAASGSRCDFRGRNRASGEFVPRSQPAATAQEAKQAMRWIVSLIVASFPLFPASGCGGLGWYRAAGHLPGVAATDYAYYDFCGTSSQLFQFPPRPGGKLH